MEIDLPSKEFITTVYHLVEDNYEKNIKKYEEYFSSKITKEIETELKKIEHHWYLSFLSNFKCKTGAKYEAGKRCLENISKINMDNK